MLDTLTRSVVMGRLFLAVSLSCGLAFADAAEGRTNTPTPNVGKERELSFIYIGSTTCSPCGKPEMVEAVNRARHILAERAASDEMLFASTGVALDESIESGLKFLDKFEAFDQIVVGRGWNNLVVIDYLCRDPDGIVGVPQVLILEQESSWVGSRRKFSTPKIVRRVVGDGILMWVKGGAPDEGW